MTYKEKTLAIRAELKKNGFNSRRVSVSHRGCGYSDAWHITVRDPEVSVLQVETIVNQFEYIRWDDYAMEILEGCNDYIIVQRDYDKPVDGGAFRSGVAKAFEELEHCGDGCGVRVDGCGWVLFNDCGRIKGWLTDEAAAGVEYSRRHFEAYRDIDHVCRTIKECELDRAYLQSKGA